VFAIEEAAHVNVWKNRLADVDIPVGPWLRELKRAVIDNRPADYPITIGSPQGTSGAFAQADAASAAERDHLTTLAPRTDRPPG